MSTVEEQYAEALADALADLEFSLEDGNAFHIGYYAAVYDAVVERYSVGCNDPDPGRFSDQTPEAFMDSARVVRNRAAVVAIAGG